MRALIISSVILFFFSTQNVVGEEKHRQLSVHEHGHSTLNLVIEGQTMLIELEAPGADIVGFEHEPSTPEQKALIDKAKKDLQAPLKLFVFPQQGNCTLKEAKVTLDAHQDGKDHHGDEHGHHDHHSDKSKKTKPESEEAEHATFKGLYKLNCKNPDQLKTIKFPYFERFSGTEELEINLITAKGQQHYEVSRDNPKVSLQGIM